MVGPMAQGTGLLLTLSLVLCKEARKHDTLGFAGKQACVQLGLPLGDPPFSCFESGVIAGCHRSTEEGVWIVARLLPGAV